jgi:hypothetical protein
MLINNSRYGISKFGGYAFNRCECMQTKSWSIFKRGHMLFGYGGHINGSSCSHLVDNVVKVLI